MDNTQEEISKSSDRNSKIQEMYREHFPLCKLMAQIPNRVHRGVIGYDLNLTCLAAHPRFLAIGVNAGLVYWYDRELDLLTRLWCSDRKTPVTSIALVETVELMLAVGNEAGGLTIFQIPRPHDPSVVYPLPSNEGCDKEEDASKLVLATMKSFSFANQHSSPITSLEWSLNGMRLFSGDLSGKVIMSQIDFVSSTATYHQLYEGTSKIVQLSYKKMLLLISTMEKNFLLSLNTKESMQIGEKPRKVEGRFGGTFLTDKTAEFIVVRPKNTLYHAGINERGVAAVKSTILMDQLLKRPHPDIPLLNPAIFQEDSQAEVNGNFNLVKNLRSDDKCLLLVFDDKTFHLVNPFKPSIEASCRGLRGVTDVSTASSSGAEVAMEEIFVLEGSRNIVRLGKMPDPYENEDVKVVWDPLAPDSTEGVGLETLSNNLVSLSESMVSKMPALTGETFFHAATAITNFSGRFNPFSVHIEAGEETARDVIEAQEELNAAKDFKDIEDNSDEVTARKSGNNKKVKRAELDSPSFEDSVVSSPSSATNALDFLDQSCSEMQESFGKLELKIDEDKSTLEEKEFELWKTLKLDSLFKRKNNAEEKESLSSNVESKSLIYGPPSESSLAQNSTSVETASVTSKTTMEAEIPESSEVKFDPKQLVHEEVWDEVVQDKNWQATVLPAEMCDLATSFDLVYLLDDLQNVFIGKNERKSMVWRKMDYKAKQISVSPNGLIFWRLERGTAFALKNFNNLESWFEVAQDVRFIGINDFSAFLIKENGDLVLMTDLSAPRPFSDKTSLLRCDEEFLQFSVTNGVFVGVTKSGKIMARNGIFKTNPVGNSWTEIHTNKPILPVRVETFQELVGTKLVLKLFVKSKDGDLFYTHGTLDEILFNNQSELKWYELSFASGGHLDSELFAKFSTNSVYLASPHMGTLFCAKSVFHGIIANELEFSPKNLRMKDFSVHGLYKQHGVLWATAFSLKPNESDLYFSKFHDSTLHRLDKTGGAIECLADAPDALWLLTNRGQILVRKGITVNVPEGTKWDRLDTSQLGNLSFQHLSLGSDAAWAVDEDGMAWMRLGPLSSFDSEAVPVWLQADDKADSDQPIPTLAKIFTSTSIHMVWALDTSRNAFVRTGIFPDFRLGLEWVPVSGLNENIATLTLSEDAVWALTLNGKVFKRCGITTTNFIGDFWRQVPTCGTIPLSISASICGRLFCISNCGGKIVEISSEEISLSHPKLSGNDSRRMPEVLEENVDGGWAVVK